MRRRLQQGGYRWPAQLGLGAAAVLAVHQLIEVARHSPSAAQQLVGLPWYVPASLLLSWRFGWAILHWIRSALYQIVVYPRLARRAREVTAERGGVRELAVLVVTYKERPEITRAVFRSIGQELDRVAPSLERAPLLVAVTGSDADDANIRSVLLEVGCRASLHLRRGVDGKRAALADGLSVIMERGLSSDGAFVMMDGDTELVAGCLERCLPLLRLEPRVAALTTDEQAAVRGPRWMAEWLHLRFGLRHLYASSISLSCRLLCLTGRFSVFHGALLDEELAARVRSDSVDNWLWGRYELLSGDDKSTWFHVLARGERLLYVPDAQVVTHEVIAGSALVRAYHNLRRWGGNMVRNSERAIRLGPRRVGWFTWWCLIDQRLSMWTSLIGPTAFAITAASGRWNIASTYVLWVLFSRSLRAAPAWQHGRRVSLFHVPLAPFFDWAGAMLKIWVLFFPARQFWHNRGKRTLDSTAGRTALRARRAVAGLLLGAAVTAFAACIVWLTGEVRVAHASSALAAGLIERALADEAKTGAGDWDAAADLSLSIRARVDVLRAGLGTEEQRRRIYQRAQATADRVLAYEWPDAKGPRGWGTARPIVLPPLSFDHVVDAYTTATALGGLTELASWALGQGDLAEARRIYRAIEPVLDDWLTNHRFPAPGGGPAFEKIVSSDTRVRGYLVHNTDAMFARVLLCAADVAAALGDPDRARSDREVAAGIVARLVRMVVDPVLERGPQDWHYGLEQRGAAWVPLRGEDTNHASYVLDTLASLVERGQFTPERLRALGMLLASAAFVAGPDGSPAITVFLGPQDAVTDDRGKRRATRFAFARGGARQREVATWRRQLSGEKREIDLGTSIRTSWGWSEAARGDPALLGWIGRYLDAEERLAGEPIAPNLFLSRAVWLRVSTVQR